MIKNTGQIINSLFQGHILQEKDLANLYEGTAARRYGLVNKAIKRKELLPLRRGLYMLASQQGEVSAYYIANQLVPFSFVTAEAALQFHQWIPERVTQMTSMIAFGRNKTFHTFLGDFIYKKSLLKLEDFYVGVDRLEINQRFVLMATPLRALVDYIHWYKIKEANMDFLKNSLRIEEENLSSIKFTEIKELLQSYKSGYVNKFLNNLMLERGKSHE